MRILTKILDTLAGLCVTLLFLKFAILTVNSIFDWNLRWYFLENVPFMAIILFFSMFLFSVPSELIKEKLNNRNK